MCSKEGMWWYDWRYWWWSWRFKFYSFEYFHKTTKPKSTFFITLLIHEKFNPIQILCLNINVNFRTISIHKYKIFTTPPSQRFWHQTSSFSNVLTKKIQIIGVRTFKKVVYLILFILLSNQRNDLFLF